MVVEVEVAVMVEVEVKRKNSFPALEDGLVSAPSSTVLTTSTTVCCLQLFRIIFKIYSSRFLVRNLKISTPSKSTQTSFALQSIYSPIKYGGRI